MSAATAASRGSRPAPRLWAAFPSVPPPDVGGYRRLAGLPPRTPSTLSEVSAGAPPLRGGALCLVGLPPHTPSIGGTSLRSPIFRSLRGFLAFMASVTPAAARRPQGARPQFCRRFLRPFCRLLAAAGFTTAKANKPLRSLVGLPPHTPFVGGLSHRFPSKYRQARPHFAGVPSASRGSRPAPRLFTPKFRSLRGL